MVRVIKQLELKESLIDLVHGHELIWNPKGKENSNNTKKAEVWQKIQEELTMKGFKVTIAEARDLWKYLRDSFVRAKIPATTGSGAEAKGTFYFWDQMSFLLQGKLEVPRLSNVSSANKEEPKKEVYQENCPEEVLEPLDDEILKEVDENNRDVGEISTVRAPQTPKSESTRVILGNGETPSSGKKRKLLSEGLTVMQGISEAIEKKLETGDKYDMFGGFIATSLREMEKKKAKQAMKDLQETFSKYQFGDSSDSE